MELEERIVKRQLIAALLVAVVAALALAACGGSSSTESSSTGGEEVASTSSGEDANSSGKTVKVASALVFQAPNQELIAEGGAQAAKEFGAEYSTAAPSEFNSTEAIADFKSLLASGAEGVAVQPYPPSAWTKAVAEAKAEGVTIASLNSPAFNIKNWLYVGADEVSLGREIAKLISEGVGPEAEGEVVLTQCLSGSSTLEDRNRGIKVGLEEFAPGLTVSSPISTQGINPTAVFGDWQRILETHSDAVAFTGVCTTDLPAMIKAKEKGSAEGILVGVDFSPPTIEAIEEGVVYGSVGQNGYQQGYITTRVILEHLVNNKPMPEGWIDSGTTPATKANIKSVAELMSSVENQVEYYKPIDEKLFENIEAHTDPIGQVRSDSLPLPNDIGKRQYVPGG